MDKTGNCLNMKGGKKTGGVRKGENLNLCSPGSTKRKKTEAGDSRLEKMGEDLSWRTSPGARSTQENKPGGRERREKTEGVERERKQGKGEVVNV